MRDSYLINLYEELEKTRGADTYKYIQDLFRDAEQLNAGFLAANRPKADVGQSWRSVKGKDFERLIRYIVTRSVARFGVAVIDGNELRSADLSEELNIVRQNIEVNYPGFGVLLPDADIVVYDPENSRVIAIISCKTSLRERFVQTAYWKLKLLAAENTAPIKIYLVTPDTDKHLTKISPAKRQRIVLETDLDGTYVLTTEPLEESDKVKLFPHFIADLEQVIQESQ